MGGIDSDDKNAQWQRLMLARLLYKRPLVLALYEAASHLDVAHECAITAALVSLSITRGIIARRPETIAAADRVLTVHDRQVKEGLQGTLDATRLSFMK